MLAHIGTKTHGRAIENHLANQAALDEDAQAVVNGGEGNDGIRFFGALENLFGGGMIMALGDDLEDLLALTRHFQTAGCQPLGQTFMCLQFHGEAETETEIESESQQKFSRTYR